MFVEPNLDHIISLTVHSSAHSTAHSFTILLHILIVSHQTYMTGIVCIYRPSWFVSTLQFLLAMT